MTESPPRAAATSPPPGRCSSAFPTSARAATPRRSAALERRLAAVPGLRLLDLAPDRDHHRSVVTLAGTRGDAARRRARPLRLGGRARRPAAPPRRAPAGGRRRRGAVRAARRRHDGRRRGRGGEHRGGDRGRLRPAGLPLRGSRRAGRSGGCSRTSAAASSRASRPRSRSPIGRRTSARAASTRQLGVTVVGARFFLLAVNARLATADVTAARAVARAVREATGGLPGVRALGLLLESRGCAQVSMNLVDFRRTSLVELLARVEAEARAQGTEVVATELVGLAPAAALLEPLRGAAAQRRAGAAADRRVAAAGGRVARQRCDGPAAAALAQRGEQPLRQAAEAARGHRHHDVAGLRPRRAARRATRRSPRRSSSPCLPRPAAPPARRGRGAPRAAAARRGTAAAGRRGRRAAKRVDGSRRRTASAPAESERGSSAGEQPPAGVAAAHGVERRPDRRRMVREVVDHGDAGGRRPAPAAAARRRGSGRSAARHLLRVVSRRRRTAAQTASAFSTLWTPAERRARAPPRLAGPTTRSGSGRRLRRPAAPERPHLVARSPEAVEDDAAGRRARPARAPPAGRRRPPASPSAGSSASSAR